MPQEQISLTLSLHFSLSFFASSRPSRLHPVSSHSCCMYVSADRPSFARPYVGVHRSTSLMSSSLLLQQWPACLVRLTRIVFVMGGRWPYSWCLVGCCRQDFMVLCLLNYPKCMAGSTQVLFTINKSLHRKSNSSYIELRCLALWYLYRWYSLWYIYICIYIYIFSLYLQKQFFWKDKKR